MKTVKGAIVTEKTVKLNELGRYTFEVDIAANKADVKSAIESVFGVSVISVRTMISRGKAKKSRKGLQLKAKKWKKAIVQVAEGQKIAALEGV